MFCLCIDLDGTLIIDSKKINSELASCRHVEEIRIKIKGYFYRYFAINRLIMQKIISSLLKRGDRVAFITSGSYDPDEMLQNLNEIFQLAPGYLKDNGCVLINKHHDCAVQCGSEEKLKGDIILSAQSAGLLPSDAITILLDDMKKQLDNAQQYFAVLKATGCPLDGGEINNDYIIELLGMLKLPITLLPLHDPCTYKMQRYRMYG